MAIYVFVYRSPEGYEGSPDGIALWNAWFDSLGDRVIDRGNPVFARDAVGIVDGSTVLGGYSLLAADDLAAAATLAKGCPAVEFGGGVEVGELTVLNAGTEFVGRD
jgi:hypothetical protein